jgi:RNA chaperone Hfq
MTITTEESFLAARVGRGSVAVYLMNGVRLVGALVAHDTEAIFLRSQGDRGGETMMIFKTAICTIVSTTAEGDRGWAR